MMTTDASPRPALRVLRRAANAVARAGRGIHWYITNLMGDRAYDAYLAHHRLHHADAPALTERAFWRERMDEQDRNPGARCC
jgi:uncharacterized short protein YbdD (DUF466 family)